jgi:hypothetical protein
MIIDDHDATTTLHAPRSLLNSAYQSGCHRFAPDAMQVKSFSLHYVKSNDADMTSLISVVIHQCLF